MARLELEPVAWCALLPGPPPCQVVMDEPRRRSWGKKKKNPGLATSESCLNAGRGGEGGARGREIVKLCVGRARRRAALALPGAAREGGPRVPPRAPAALRPPPHARDLGRARHRWSAAPGLESGVPRGRAGERGRGGRERTPRGSTRAELAPRYSNPSTSGTRSFPASGRFLASSVPTAGAGGHQV